jgi:hypothetical protein
MTDFVAVGYEWRELPGAENASVEIEVVSEIDGLFVWSATQPAAVDRPPGSKVLRRGMPPNILVGVGKLWVKASGDRNSYIDFDILAGGAGGVDAVARALAQVPTGEAGEAIDPGEERMIGGHLYTNPTATAINVPAVITPANVLALGFTEITGAGELYNAIQTAANVTHGATVRGVYARTTANATETRFPVGLPVGTERRVSREGANNADVYIGDGTVEIIDASGDGGIRLNFDRGYVLIKKTGATTWETRESAHAGIGGGGTTPATPGAGHTHIQTVAATVWTVNHNLGYRPLVQAYDVAGDDLGSLDFKHVSINQLTLTFAAATSGEARCA